MRSHTGAAAVFLAALGVALAGCSPAAAQPPTFGPEFAVGGQGLGERCSSSSMPIPAGAVVGWCEIGVEASDLDSPSGPTGSHSALSLEPGRYWVVLWCEAGTGMDISFQDVPGLAPVTAACPAGAEPAVVEVGVLESAGEGWLGNVATGTGTYAGWLVRT